MRRALPRCVALLALTAGLLPAAETAPKVVMITMTFDSPSSPLGGEVTGHIVLTDGNDNPATLDDDLTVTVSCDVLGVATISQPQTIPAGATSADFSVHVIGPGNPLLSFTGDAGIYGAIHAGLSIRGPAN